jgi:hypothetical protein
VDDLCAKLNIRWSSKLLGSQCSITTFEIMGFLLDSNNPSSELIPKIFRWTNRNLRSDFDYRLGLNFVSLIPFFTDLPSADKCITILARIIETEDDLKVHDPEYIPISICTVSQYIKDLKFKLSKEVRIRLFKISDSSVGFSPSSTSESYKKDKKFDDTG